MKTKHYGGNLKKKRNYKAKPRYKAKRRNIEIGFRDAHGIFHPSRYSKDYDPDRAGEGWKNPKGIKMTQAEWEATKKKKRAKYPYDIAQRKKHKAKSWAGYKKAKAGRAKTSAAYRGIQETGLAANKRRKKKRNIPLFLANKGNFQKMYDDVTYIEATKGKDFGVTKGKYYHEKEHKKPMRAYRIKSGSLKNSVILTDKKLN